ncbi:hypothetical protein [Pseudomonas costantinii]|uniref:hypothetical protein n=1 Tax=Pseudomonas costantinii TaxID=168469 RepID=UPI0015A3E1B9|nr:hypothetical protein [Pseudomonas costantinii]NVZ68263.1 hypothetical protein [Pseudomonas costantinii]
MAVKLKSLPFVVLCTVLAAPDARAENCRLSVSQPRIDYGVIRREDPVERASLALGTRALHVNVLCTEPAAMALRFIGVSADGQGFRFGRQGRFRLSLKHAQMDGRAVEWAATHLPGEPASGQLLPGQTLVARAAGLPVVGRRLTAQVDIDTELPSAALEVRSETRLEGQGSFELVSLPVPPNQ